MGTRIALILALLTSAVAEAESGLVGPYLQDVSSSGFVVVVETDLPSRARLQVSGALKVAAGGGAGGGSVDSPQGRRHELRISGLQPATRYGYQVLLDGVRAAEGDVATAPSGSEPITFLVFGDNRNGGEREVAVLQALEREAADFVLHTGDFVPRGDDDEAWLHFFAVAQKLLARLPIYPAIGNHELIASDGGRFDRFFVLPEGAEGRRYYAFTWGASRFLVLDGNRNQDPQQLAWLKDRLEEKAATHTFVVMHQPPFTVGPHCQDSVPPVAWVELFERHKDKVRAIFAGHDHAYERLERNGVVYFVSGGGGAPAYREETRCPQHDLEARRVYSSLPHYLRVRVVGDRVEVAAIPVDGTKLETVSLAAGQVGADVVHGAPIETEALHPIRRSYVATVVLVLVIAGIIFLRRHHRRSRT